MDLQSQASQHFKDILTHALKHDDSHRALVIFDRKNELTSILVDAFRSACPQATFIDFDTVDPLEVRQSIFNMSAGDLVVLLQSSNFRLNEFRLRIELFARGLKTMELTHLQRISKDQWPTYVQALAYDANYLRPLGHSLKAKLDRCQTVTVRGEGTTLVYEGGMEATKLNIGDYTGMKNTGGTFPIGEVFTEPKDLSRINGDFNIFAFAHMDHIVHEYKPFKAHVIKGILSVGEDAPQEFKDILAMIAKQEAVMLREFGLGLNRAMGKGKLVNDITAFERMNGLHMSVGGKHAIYKKPGLPAKKMRYHVDVFVDATSIEIDGQAVFASGQYQV